MYTHMIMMACVFLFSVPYKVVLISETMLLINIHSIGLHIVLKSAINQTFNNSVQL